MSPSGIQHSGAGSVESVFCGSGGDIGRVGGYAKLYHKIGANRVLLPAQMKRLWTDNNDMYRTVATHAPYLGEKMARRDSSLIGTWPGGSAGINGGGGGRCCGGGFFIIIMIHPFLLIPAAD